MNLSEKSLAVLTNFTEINNSILVKKGTQLRTISVAKNILAEANIEEEFPRDFGIYDLSQFLNGLTLHENPDLDFSPDSYLSIREGKSSVKYFYADPQVIIAPPEKEITLPSEDVHFKLDSASLEKLIKVATVYQLPDLSVVGEAGAVKLVVRDKKNDTSNSFSVVVADTDNEFSFNFKVENIKIPCSSNALKKGLPSTYDVVVSQKLLSRFTSTDNRLTYYIALEPDSTFG